MLLAPKVCSAEYVQIAVFVIDGRHGPGNRSESEFRIIGAQMAFSISNFISSHEIREIFSRESGPLHYQERCLRQGEEKYKQGEEGEEEFSAG